MTAARPAGVALRPLELLFETPGLPDFDLPGELAETYGGTLGLPDQCVYANFVVSLDGVTALPHALQSSHLIAGSSEHDRFVMGLLRACADAVLVGAGTFHGSPHTRWTAEYAYPPAAGLYAELRQRRGRPEQPVLAVLTGSGRLDPEHPALAGQTIVLTSETGAAHLRSRLPEQAEIVVIGERSPLDPALAVEALRSRGHGLILSEGGPSVFGALVAAGLVDELFLTLSPVIAGRGAEARLALLEGAELLPARVLAGELLTLRRAASHLFLRYRLPRS